MHFMVFYNHMLQKLQINICTETSETHFTANIMLSSIMARWHVIRIQHRIFLSDLMSSHASYSCRLIFYKFKRILSKVNFSNFLSFIVVHYTMWTASKFPFTQHEFSAVTFVCTTTEMCTHLSALQQNCAHICLYCNRNVHTSVCTATELCTQHLSALQQKCAHICLHCNRTVHTTFVCTATEMCTHLSALQQNCAHMSALQQNCAHIICLHCNRNVHTSVCTATELCTQHLSALQFHEKSVPASVNFCTELH
jgi:hypothetical protein